MTELIAYYWQMSVRTLGEQQEAQEEPDQIEQRIHGRGSYDTGGSYARIGWPVMSRAENPIIAVNGQLVAGALKLDNRYADSVMKAGGVPVVIPPIGGPADIERLLDCVDGVLLTGGDDFDFVLIQKALERDLPILGICYGMQLMGLHGGGELFQHLPEDRPGCQEHKGNVIHDVRIEAGSKLARLLGVETIATVSRHHQALARVASPWMASAVDSEGLIEAIECKGRSFAIGVQWHPELAGEGSGHDRLFRGLVGAAGMSAARQLAHP